MFHKSEGAPLSTDDILTSLNAMEDRSWGEWKNGKHMSAIQLARLLKHFKIRPKTIRRGEDTFKGYATEDCEQQFSRYLPNSPSEPSRVAQINEIDELAPEQPVTSAVTLPSEPSQCVTGRKVVTGGSKAVTVHVTGRAPSKLAKNKECDGVTGQNGKTTDPDDFNWATGKQDDRGGVRWARGEECEGDGWEDIKS